MAFHLEAAPFLTRDPRAIMLGEGVRPMREAWQVTGENGALNHMTRLPARVWRLQSAGRRRWMGTKVGSEAGTTAEQVLEVLAAEPLRPSELVAKLEGKSDEPAVRKALWKLLDDGRLELTQNRKLRAAAGGKR